MSAVEKKEKEIAELENNGTDIADVKDNKNIELIAALTLFSMTLISETSRTIGMEKECYSHPYYNYWNPIRIPWNSICLGIRYQFPVDRYYERYVQENHSYHLIWRSAVQSIMGCLILTFLGGWSDKTGKRKAILTLPITGMCFVIIHSIINIIFMDELPVEYFVFFDAFFGSFISVGVVFFGFFTYVFEFSTAEDRLSRLGGVVINALIGTAIGYTFSWILLRYLGYTSVFVVASIVNAINHWNISKRLEDPFRTNEQILYDSQSCKEFLKTFFDCSSIKETIAIVRKKTTEKRNVKLYISLATMFLLFASVFGEPSIYHMYFRYNLYWVQYEFNIFNVVKSITAILGIWITLNVISKRYQFHDAVIGVISSISKIISSIFFCFAFTDVAIYFGVVFDMFNGTALLATISMYSKLLERDEIGKINSLVGIIENMARLVYIPIYWAVSVGWMSVELYFTGFGFTLPALCIFIWILHEKKIDDVRKELLGNNAVNI